MIGDEDEGDSDGEDKDNVKHPSRDSLFFKSIGLLFLLLWVLGFYILLVICIIIF